jgi:hypothetical protein
VTGFDVPWADRILTDARVSPWDRVTAIRTLRSASHLSIRIPDAADLVTTLSRLNADLQDILTGDNLRIEDNADRAWRAVRRIIVDPKLDRAHPDIERIRVKPELLTLIRAASGRAALGYDVLGNIDDGTDDGEEFPVVDWRDSTAPLPLRERIPQHIRDLREERAPDARRPVAEFVVAVATAVMAYAVVAMTGVWFARRERVTT